MCDKLFKEPGNLAVHMETVHEGVKKHACSECGEKFGQKSSLKRHYLSKHKGFFYKCCINECGWRDGEKGRMRQHVE